MSLQGYYAVVSNDYCINIIEWDGVVDLGLNPAYEIIPLPPYVYIGSHREMDGSWTVPASWHLNSTAHILVSEWEDYTGRVGVLESTIEDAISEGGLAGKSAYEVAVDNGFVGNEAAWLASLVGAAGTNGYTVRTSDGAPSDGTGVNGDYNIDATNWNVYGPKTAGSWGSPTSIVGPAGTNGNSVLSSDGAPDNGDGQDGDFNIDVTNGVLYGPKATVWGTGLSLIGPAGPLGSQRYYTTGAPDNGDGVDGDISFDTTTGDEYKKISGTWVLQVTLALPTEVVTPPADLESDDGTLVPDDADFIYTSAGDDFRLGVAYGSDYRVLRNGAEVALPMVAVQLLYYQADGATQRDLYAVNNAGDWFIWSGPVLNGTGFTAIAGDPRPFDESLRDPTDPVSIQANGKYVYRFAAAHALTGSPFTIATFDATNDGGHDILKLGEALVELGKTASDVVLDYGGTPDAILTVTGTDFEIDFTTVTGTDGSVSPTSFYSLLGSTTTDNAATLSFSSTIPSGHTNTIALVCVQIKAASGTVADITSVTIGGNAMTRITGANQINSSYNNRLRAAWFYRLNPGTGSQTIVVTPDYSGGKLSGSIAANLVVCDNVNQSTPLGTNFGLYDGTATTLSVSITTLNDNSLVVAQSLMYSPNVNPVTPGSGVTELIDADVGAYNDSGALGTWVATKATTGAGSVTVNGTIGANESQLNSALEVRGVATSDLFDIGPYLTTNIAGGGPDIATDVTPSDWPVAEGTGFGGGGGENPNPTPGDYWAGVLASHGMNSDLSRSWATSELTGFAVNASAFRLFGYQRLPPYGSFASDTQNIDLIERAMAAGMRVLYSPFTATASTASFPAASNTALVSSMGARAADICAVALARSWPTDQFAFEMYNEPLNSLGQANAFAVYQTWVNTIRSSNSDIWLVAMGNGREGNSYEAYYAGWLRSGVLTDPRMGEHRIAYGHHQYLPMEFTHQGTSGNFPTGVSYPSPSYGLAQIRAQLTAFRDWANTNSVQIMIGETGAVKFAPSLAQRQQYVSDVFQVSRELAIPCFIWCDDTSNSSIGSAWFTIMQGTAGAASFVPSWAALIGSAGQ